MNKRDAKVAVNRLTAWSLRRLAKSPERWTELPLPRELTKHQQGKITAAMVELADKLEPKEIEHAAVETRVNVDAA